MTFDPATLSKQELLVHMLRCVVADCESNRRALSAATLDPLAEAVHMAQTVELLTDALDHFEPGLGMRLHTALYVQVHALPTTGDLFPAAEAAPAAVH
jgi:hypothetical protein